MLRNRSGSGFNAVLAGTYKLSEIHHAQEDFKTKGFVGKLVLVPDSKWDIVGKQFAA